MGDFEGSMLIFQGVIKDDSKILTEFLSNVLKPSPYFFKILSHCLAKFCDVRTSKLWQQLGETVEKRYQRMFVF